MFVVARCFQNTEHQLLRYHDSTKTKCEDLSEWRLPTNTQGQPHYVDLVPNYWRICCAYTGDRTKLIHLHIGQTIISQITMLYEFAFH